MNQITHFLDNSNVYGSDDEEAASLRTFKRGLLRVAAQGGHGDLGLLPPDENPEMECQANQNRTSFGAGPEHKCFKAGPVLPTFSFDSISSWWRVIGIDWISIGDSRANEAPPLAVAHTLFMREHNRLAYELAHLNPHWDDERLYQEARRILIGQMQHITYNEWLPIIIGTDFQTSFIILQFLISIWHYIYNMINDDMINICNKI